MMCVGEHIYKMESKVIYLTRTNTTKILNLCGGISLMAMTACVEPDNDSGTQEEQVQTTYQASMLCDGSDDLKLTYKITGSGQIFAGDMLLSEQGASYLYVDGHCSYWTYSGGHKPTKTGTLTDAQALQILSALEPDQWTIDGMGFKPDMNVSHPSHIQVSLSDQSFSCSGSCQSNAQADRIQKAIHQHQQDLYDEGVAMHGSVRVLAIDASATTPSSWNYNVAQWPLQQPLNDMIHTLDEVEGMNIPLSSAVTIDAELDAIHQLRQQYFEGAIVPEHIGFIPISTGDDTFIELYVRDVLPFETR